MNGDLVNALFECGGAGFCLLSILRLRRDREVRGVSWLHAGFFVGWGWWNVWFYPSVGLWYSWAGGLLLAATNTTWLGQLIWHEFRRS